jgi:hypothetical protein
LPEDSTLFSYVHPFFKSLPSPESAHTFSVVAMDRRDTSDSPYSHSQALMPGSMNRQQYQQTVPIREEMEAVLDVPPSYEASQSTKAEQSRQHDVATTTPAAEANRGPATLIGRPANVSPGDRPRRSDTTGVSSTFSAATVDTVGYQSTHAMVWDNKEAEGRWDRHTHEPGCCGSTTGGCCFSRRGGCFFSDRDGCCFSDREGCCFSDRGGCCFGDMGGCFCAQGGSCCCSRPAN